MAKKFKYQTTLIKGPFKGVYAEFPFNSNKEFGTKKHVWCKIKVDGKAYSMNLMPNGIGGHWLHFKKEIRDTIGKHEGDTVNIELEKDNKPRTVLIPEYLQWLLDDDPQMARWFERMPISGKKFWIQHIEEPRKDGIKVKRINRLFEFLHEHYAGKVQE